MSENYEIGLSKDQIDQILKGKTIGKRPYDEIHACSKCDRPIDKPRYAQIRVFVRMLTDEERAKEPDVAFGW